MDHDERVEETPPEPLPRRQELLGTLGIWAAVTVACAVLWQLRRFVGFVGQHLHALIAVIFLYLPTWLVSRRREDYADYAMTHRPVALGLIFFAGISLAIFPAFAAALLYYYRYVCGVVAQGGAMPGVYHRLCRRFVGSWGRAQWRLPGDFLQLAAAQLVVVALPEEYFFRGYVQTRLERVWPPRRRPLGGGVGIALVVTSVLFALGHVLVDFNGLRLAVFFPSLLFGWLRSATGSILAGVLFHACCNLISELLHTVLFVQ